MSYSPTTWSAGDVITAAKMNKIEQGIVTAESSGGSGSGGEYDLVIASTTRVGTGVQNINNWSIISGSIANCEDKLENGLPINAMAIVWTAQWSMDPPNDIRFYLPLIQYMGPYRWLQFGGVFNDSSPSNSTTNWTPVITYVTFGYNSSKQLSHAHYNMSQIVLDL